MTNDAYELTSDPDCVPRHGLGERVSHWLVAALYVLLLVSGLALFEPAFYWLSLLFGGGSLMRLVHPYLGVALALLFAGYAAKVWRDNYPSPNDDLWLRHAPAIMAKRIEFPVEGKYNAGQKVLFWFMLVVIIGLLASGVLIWRPWFAPHFSGELRRIAAIAHALLGLLMFVGIGIHVYAAYWTRGAIAGMTRGSVPRAWARFHYPGWLRKVESKPARARNPRT
jgi:formate dehydrogenase subunit gamma